MSKSVVLISVLLTMVVSLAGMSAGADNVTINTTGTTPFVYQGRSYLPLRSTAGFLGATVLWDAAKGQAVMTYNGQDLALTPNSLKALLAGKPVVLPSPPVVVSGVTYVPAAALREFYNIPVEWDGKKSAIGIKGPSGWATVKPSSRAPWHGGPPPWAPAWGQRRNAATDNNEHLKGGSKQPHAAQGKVEAKPKDETPPAKDQQGKGQAKPKGKG